MSKDNHFVYAGIEKLVKKGVPFTLAEVREENAGFTAINHSLTDEECLDGFIAEGELKLENGKYIPQNK